LRRTERCGLARPIHNGRNFRTGWARGAAVRCAVLRDFRSFLAGVGAHHNRSGVCICRRRMVASGTPDNTKRLPADVKNSFSSPAIPVAIGSRHDGCLTLRSKHPDVRTAVGARKVDHASVAPGRTRPADGVGRNSRLPRRYRGIRQPRRARRTGCGWRPQRLLSRRRHSGEEGVLGQPAGKASRSR
jgi:hypothetical protein